MLAILLLLAALCPRLTAARPPTTFSTTTLDPAALPTLTPRNPLPTVPGPALTTSPSPSPTPAPPAPVPTPPPTTPPNPYIIPTSLLSQVPALWPYTKYGIGTGREGETASWGITDGAGVTVAVVKHRVLLFEGEGDAGGDVRLRGWRRRFVVPRGTGG